ncbi:mannitol dehydrogenase family protein [Labrys okinawensis]|uniref:mannitol dehydrogenase family protein n=1 Tax=Labrys okinawensis TaxID=346911 RepID=UPI0039BC8366
MQRLAQDTLAKLSPGTRRPHYDRTKLAIGMAHIGVGAFHRCHQGEFTDDMLEARFGPWGVVGINLRPPLLTDILAPQDGLYSRTLREGTIAETRVIGALRKVIDVRDPADGEAAISALAAPQIKVVTMTLTEKGYCHIPSSGTLDWSRPDIIRDREGASPPASALGLLAAALERRRQTGGGGLTLISCDNVPGNGALLRSVLTAFIAAQLSPLASWIETNVAFPSTMVDRIAPAPMAEDLVSASEAIGLRDEAAVVGEPFRQWVIDDRFAADHPPWDLAGAQFVADVTPYELIKMRVLNAAQSTLSHLGALLGHAFSFQAADDPVLAPLVRRMLVRETAGTLPNAPGMEISAYIDTSLSRIANSAIRHRCHQIGTDGSQKIVQRLLNPLRGRLAAGHAPGLLALAVASWLAYVLCGARRHGARWQPNDPMAAGVIAIGEQGGDDFDGLARALIGIEQVFGSDLRDSTAVPAIAMHLRGLLGGDVRGYLRECLVEYA